MSRTERILNQLTKELQPSFIQVDDESGQHHVPIGGATHIKIVTVSSCFNNLNLVARHRLVNNLLLEEFNQGLHALTMHLYTEDEWVKKNQTAPKSPNCRDGFNKK